MAVKIDGSIGIIPPPIHGEVVGTTTAQSISNKTINLSTNTIITTLAQLNSSIVDAELVDLGSFDSHKSDINNPHSVTAAQGDGWVDGHLVKPEPPAAMLPAEPALVSSEPIKVSPVEFKLLFTSPERVAIKQARATDPVIDDFYDIIDDPRLTYVDLGLKVHKMQ